MRVSMKGEHPAAAVQPGPEMDRPDSVVCVDLDGTLLATDLLWESTLQLLKKEPWMLFAIPLWLFRGKANLKRQLARRVSIDGSRLPYRQEVLEYLRLEQEKGRRIVLATASDQEAIGTVVQHLDIFSEVISSDGKVNLSGRNKEEALVRRFGLRGFDYIGNGSNDTAVWRSANAAILVDASASLLRSAQRSFNVTRVFPRKSRLRPAWKALRAYQWCKNLLVFVPLAMAHRVLEWQPVFHALVSFAVLSMCASGVYILNDLLDLPADRAHPRKKTRPFAAGTLPISFGVGMMIALILTGTTIAAVLLPPRFLLLLLLYLVVTTAYSVYIKRLIIADIMALAGLYTLRILAGAVASEVPVSFWLLAFSMFFFLSLAFMKRYVELKLMELQGAVRSAGRGYRNEDLGVLETMGTVTSFMSILVLALFINSNEVVKLYHRPQLLWLVCPALMYWIARMWFRAQRGSFDDDDPIVSAFKDKVSYFLALVIMILVALAT